jgi:hypothetical protein
VAWLDVPTEEIVALFSTSVGQPGTGINHEENDYSSDYLIMHAPGVPEKGALFFDDKPGAVKDRVWLPNKDMAAVDGYERVEGVIVEVGPTHCAVEFDKPLRLQSQSGSPLISIKTGRVVGVLAAADARNGKQVVLFAKSEYFASAIKSAKDLPALQQVVGKR